jgi:uncharacterized protein
MITRKLLGVAEARLQKYPLLAITGPRQSGKTTFCKMLRPDYQYLNLELPDLRDFATRDPHLFLQTYRGGVILDEVQQVPELFSYLQYYTDERQLPGEYILSGSQNFLLLEKITQSLAGRIAIFHLLPFSLEELNHTPYQKNSWESYLLQGFYPRTYKSDIPSADFYPDYIQTYCERDVRQILQVTNLSLFQSFMRLCAGRVGQLVNINQLGAELGIDQRTVKAWLSILEASFIIYLLQPYHKNFEKRIVKSPKLYFYDTGLAAYLLGLRNEDDLLTHFARGALFENFTINELLKNQWNQGLKPGFYFWRDSNTNEIDLLIESGLSLDIIEIKSGKTIKPDFFKNIEKFNLLQVGPAKNWLVYGGDEAQFRSTGQVVPWSGLGAIG